MKLTFYSFFLLFLLTSCVQKTKLAGGYQLVWSDEFETPGTPDSRKWSYDVGGHGFGNNELQFYTKGRPENARVEGGKLIVEARKEPWEGSGYTSAKLVSRGKQSWLYGKFEVSAKLPKGRGTWPAIWMMPEKDTHGGWPASGEIDIMEHVGFDPGVVHGSVHTEAYNHVIGTQKSNKMAVPDAMDTFHNYTVEWTPDSLLFFIDGKRYHSFANEHKTYKEWPCDHPFYMILNIAVGGNWGGQKGVDDSIWPQKMEVDYVRVYQRKG
jgi:beta-glucanase (GH16 family)